MWRNIPSSVRHVRSNMHQRSSSRTEEDVDQKRWVSVKQPSCPLPAFSLVRKLQSFQRPPAFSNTALSFTGVLFICFNVDYRVLFLPVTDETVADAFQFYTMFYNAPPAIKVRILLRSA